MGRHSRPDESDLPTAYTDLYMRLGKIVHRWGDVGPRLVSVQKPPAGALGPGKRNEEATSALMWGLPPKENDMDKDRTRDVTDKVRERGGIPDPPEDTTPGWFARLDPLVKTFFNEVIDAATTEAARRFKEEHPKKATTPEPGKAPKGIYRIEYPIGGPAKFYDKKGNLLNDETDVVRDLFEKARKGAKEAPSRHAAASEPDELGDAVAELFSAGKKVLKAFVNEVLG